MASQDWLEIYRSYGGAELETEIASLKSQVSIFSSQNLGSKSFTRDLGELRNRLQAAVRARTEKAKPNVSGSGTVDYSEVRVS